MAVEGFPARNAHGVVHKRNLPQSVMSPIPDLRSGLDDPPTSPAFQGNPIYVRKCFFFGHYHQETSNFIINNNSENMLREIFIFIRIKGF